MRLTEPIATQQCDDSAAEGLVTTQRIVTMLHLRTLSKHQLEAEKKKILNELNRRYAKHKGPKYGHLNRGFEEQQKESFFNALTKNTKLRAIFTLEGSLGLRLGEACELRAEDVHFHDRRLWVQSEKGSVPTMLYLHDEVLQVLQAYERERRPHEYYFPAEDPLSKYPHISPNYVRKRFYMARKKAGLNFSYGKSDESTPRPSRKLYQFTTHSLRHHFGRKIWKMTGDLLMTQKLLRHKDIQNTLIYVKVHQEEIDNTLIKVFS